MLFRGFVVPQQFLAHIYARWPAYTRLGNCDFVPFRLVFICNYVTSNTKPCHHKQPHEPPCVVLCDDYTCIYVCACVCVTPISSNLVYTSCGSSNVKQVVTLIRLMSLSWFTPIKLDTDLPCCLYLCNVTRSWHTIYNLEANWHVTTTTGVWLDRYLHNHMLYIVVRIWPTNRTIGTAIQYLYIYNYF